MDTEELESHMDLTEAELQVAYKNILKIKEQCEDYSLKKPLKIPELTWKKAEYITTEIKDKYFKEIPELLTFYTADYKGDKLLAELVINKLEKETKLQEKKIYNTINECLEMTRISSEVNNTHWSAYFLNLQKIIDCCWEAGSLVGAARGSGAGFILLYMLDLIQINPEWEDITLFPWRLDLKAS